MLDCIRANVQVTDLRYDAPGGFPAVLGRIENNLPWPITGFRFDAQVEDTATGTVWQRSQAGTGELDPPLQPGQARDFEIYSAFFDVADPATIRLTPEMWDVLDPEGREVIDDHRAVTPESYQRSRSQRTCE